MRICSIGECMIELSNIRQNIFKLAHAGDTANTSIYLSRLGANSSYLTSVGNDYLSNKMIQFLKNEKVYTKNIYYNANKTVGLYLIQNNKKGERKFFYWRSDSAARTLFENVKLNNLLKQMAKYEAIYFSGITLSIYDQKSIEKFYKLLVLLKIKGIKIYFDFNVRLNNWINQIIAKKTILKFSLIADLSFMTREDIENLKIKNFKNTIKKNYKNKIVIFRSENGDVDVFNKTRFEKYKFKLNKKVIDTTGCGDAFNACFIYNYFNNHNIKDCIDVAHKLGKLVAQSKGAIINKKKFKKNLYAI